jgi:hypothetical protein
MEEVRRVMRPKVMGHVCQKPRGLIAGRLDHWTVETRQGLLHQRLPGVLISRLGRLLQHHGVAHRLDANRTETTRTGFILRHRDLFGGHLVRQPRALLVAVHHDGLFHATVDLVLRPIRGADKPIETRHLQQQTHQANPTGTHFGTHQMERQHQAMQEGKTGHTVKKRHDSRTLVEALLVRPPRLQRAPRHLKHLGRLTLGDALGLQIAIPLKKVSAFEAIPALVLIIVASLRLLDYRAHSYLLLQPFAFVFVMAKDDEGACWFQLFAVSSHRLSGAVIETKWPTP